MLQVNQQQLKKAFTGFEKNKVLIIGDVMIDSYIYGKVDRISPEAPVPVVSVLKREDRLGGAANVMLNVQALGAVPIICSVIGNDLKGDEFIRLLNLNNISSKGILRSNRRITSTKYRIIGNNAQMLRVDDESVAAIDKKTHNELIILVEKIIIKNKPDVIIFEDYDKGVISKSLIHEIVKLAVKFKIPVAVDPKSKNFHHYKHVSLFKPNLKELCDGLKTSSIKKDKANLTKICSAFQQKQNIDLMLLTLSENGIFYNNLKPENQRQSEIIPAQIRNIADVSGAGDTVIAVAGLCMAQKLSTYDTAFISNIAGGLVCEEIGVKPVDKIKLFNELLKFID